MRNFRKSWRGKLNQLRERGGESLSFRGVLEQGNFISFKYNKQEEMRNIAEEKPLSSRLMNGLEDWKACRPSCVLASGYVYSSCRGLYIIYFLK